MYSSTNLVHSTFTAGAGASLLCSGDGEGLQPVSDANIAATIARSGRSVERDCAMCETSSADVHDKAAMILALPRRGEGDAGTVKKGNERA